MYVCTYYNNHNGTTYIHMHDQACENQKCELKITVFSTSLYHNFITINTNTINCLPLLQNLMAYSYKLQN